MLKKIDVNDITKLSTYLESREMESDKKIIEQVENILIDVRKNGDQALFEYTKKFDGVELNQLLMCEEEKRQALSLVEQEFIDNLEEAKRNITLYHEKQIHEGYEIQKENGVYLGQRVLPLHRVGVYVPGGRATYPSSVLMNVIPAKIAGVKDIVMVTPPNKEGSVNPYIVAAAQIAGVDKIYKIGGAQAIAALAYGSETICKVDKIVGPGNAYVAQAKRMVYGRVDIDMIAGPSEILVIADQGANPSYVAADLISQAEHDPMASSILLTTDTSLIEKVEAELVKQSACLPKKEIIETSFANYGVAMVCESMEQCIKISNTIAPEHLELMVADAKTYLPFITNAGSVFLGYFTCESIGDYFGGTNHVLPTNGTARFYSPLSCDSFIKKSSYLFYSEKALKQDGEKIINIAHNENLDGHANAVKVRLAHEED